MKEEDKGIIKVTVRDKADKYTPIANARVQVQQSVPSGGKAKRGFEAPTAAPPSSAPIETKTTDQNGHAEFELNPGEYQVSVAAFVKVVDKVTYVEMNIRRRFRR